MTDTPRFIKNLSRKPISRLAAAAFALLFTCLPLCAQSNVVMVDDPKVILEVGAATSWNLSGGAATFAPSLSAEMTPVEHWLELEAGVSVFYTRTATEWDTDLLFKMPRTISPKAEFMLGMGPQWVHLNQNGRSSNSVALEVAGDFMFWPSGRHHFGWFVEPAYDYSFAAGHQQSIGMSAGLLIGVGRPRRR